jgi:hypothetical protein
MAYGRKETTYHNSEPVLLFIYDSSVIVISGNRIQSKTRNRCSILISFFAKIVFGN